MTDAERALETIRENKEKAVELVSRRLWMKDSVLELARERIEDYANLDPVDDAYWILELVSEITIRAEDPTRGYPTDGIRFDDAWALELAEVAIQHAEMDLEEQDEMICERALGALMRHAKTGLYDLRAGDVPGQLETIADLKRVVGDKVVDDAIEDCLKNRCFANDDHSIGYNYWECGDEVISPNMLQGWLDSKPWRDIEENVKLGLTLEQAASASLDHYCFDEIISIWWWHDCETWEWDSVLDNVDAALSKLELPKAYGDGYKWLPDRGELMEELNTDYEVSVYPDLDGELARDVHADLYIATPAEVNADLSTLANLADAMHEEPRDRDIAPQELDNGLGWLCEQRGLPKTCMVCADSPDNPGHDIWRELKAFDYGPMGALCIPVSCSIREWATLAAVAHIEGTSFELNTRDAYATIHDRYQGAGSYELEAIVPEKLVVPHEVLFDAAVQGPHGRGHITDKAGQYALDLCYEYYAPATVASASLAQSCGEGALDEAIRDAMVPAAEATLPSPELGRDER